MIEVVFGESTFGSMMMAKVYDSNRWKQAAIGYIGKKPSDDELSEMHKGEALPGRKEDVIAINFSLDMGALAGGVDSDERRNLLRDMSRGPVGMGDESNERADDLWTRALEQVEILKEKAHKGESFRIWYSDRPSELCGYYFVCSILQAFECSVSAVKLPKLIEGDQGEIIQYKSWGEIALGKFYLFTKYEESVSPLLLKHNRFYWKQLENENANLRASIDGGLKSVTDDFYDAFIRSHLSGEAIKMAKVIGQILGHEQLKVSDYLIRNRIRWMISTGEVKVVQASEHEYEFHIKLA